MLDQKRITFIFQLNLALTLAEGMLVLWSFIKKPSEPGSAVFFGFSYLRLVLILVVLSLLLTILILLFGSFRNSWQARASEKFLVRLANRKGIFWILTLWMAICYILLFLSEQQLGFLASYRERLLPILLWLALLSIQLGFVILYFRGINSKTFCDYRSILISSLMILISFGVLLLIIKLTRLGLAPDSVYWQGPGVPILLHQVLLAAFAGILFYLFIERTHPERSTRLDVIVFLGLWGFACLIWLNQPAKLTWFSLEPTAPNYQSYPFSDALVYDNTAREFLIGKPIPSDFWSKPLYSLFLAVLHLFSGGNYTFLVSLQVIFLATIPAFAFLLTTRLDARPAGMIVALLIILREHNALMLSDVIQVSHVKLLLSDVFAMGFMVLLLWLFFHWLEKPGERRVTPLVLGGVFSLLVLTRGHPVILLPFILCAVFLVPFPRSTLRWEAITLAVLGFIIPLIPWFWRNYELTGKLAFQYPVSPYSAFISAHYFHNAIFSYIYLPYSFRIANIKEYVRTESFWSSWTGELSFEEWILLFINIAMIALGFGYLWKKHKYLAFVPLIFGIGYNFSVSIGRLSGWRFILPADWITLIYYAIGLMQFYSILRSFTNQETKFSVQEQKTQNTVQSLKQSSLIMFMMFFLVIGIALTKGQELFSQRYPAKSMLQLKKDYSRNTNMSPASVPSVNLDDFLKTDDAVIVYGQALNPSFLIADEGKGNDSWPVYYFWPNYKPKPFSRIIFNLNGPRSAGVILPLASPPSSFPDGSDVIVIGCLGESGEINALSVLIQGATPIHYIREPFPSLTCPLSEPD